MNNLLQRTREYYKQANGISRGKKAPVSVELDGDNNIKVLTGQGHYHLVPMQALTARGI